MFPYSAIASSVKKLKEKNNSVKTRQKNTPHPVDTVTKEQYFKWQEEGKCGCCGAESGEFLGICDECRYS